MNRRQACLFGVHLGRSWRLRLALLSKGWQAGSPASLGCAKGFL
jgi:hypothetical protein